MTSRLREARRLKIAIREVKISLVRAAIEGDERKRASHACTLLCLMDRLDELFDKAEEPMVQ